MPATLVQQIQRSQPLTATTSRVVYMLPLDRLNPVIRIAHRRDIAVPIGPRLVVDHELVYVRSGRGVYRTADRTVALDAGACVLVRPFVPHMFEPTASIDHLAIHFDLAGDVPPPTIALEGRQPYAVRLAGSLDWPSDWVWPREHPHAHVMQQVVDDFCAGGPLASAAASLRLGLLLLTLLRDASDVHDRTNVNRSRMTRAVTWLDANLHRDVVSDDLAAAAGLSPSHFRRVFHAWAGMNASEFIQRSRVARARELLRDPDISVKQVAAKIGFADPFHFSRVFRRIDGLSPTQFREAALAGQAMIAPDMGSSP